MYDDKGYEDYISSLIDEVNDLQFENARLRVLVRGLEVCATEDADARTDCPLYDEQMPNRCKKESLMSELGVKENRDG